MKNLLTYVLILGGVILATLSGCKKEEIQPSETKAYNIFEKVGPNPYINKLVSFLKKEGDTASFRRTFALEYGIPQWSKAIVLQQGSITTMFVPLKDCDASFLSGIWVFEVKDGRIRYRVARNEQCKPYYKMMEPFFGQFEQELFKKSRNGNVYRLEKSFTKYGSWVTTTYCLTTVVSSLMGKEYGGSSYCWNSSTYIEFEDNNFGEPTDGGNQVGEPYIGGGTPTVDPEPVVRTLAPDEKAKLDKAVEEVNKRGCGASMAYDMVGSRLGNYTFTIDPSIKGAGYNPQTKNFVFKDADEINPQRLTEEIIHAAQDLLYPNGTYQYKDTGKPNVEFEAKILVEISTFAKLGCCINAQLYLNDNDYLNFLDNLRSWVQNGRVDQIQYNGWLNKWYNTPNNEYYHKGSVNGSLSPELLNKLLKESFNCVKTSVS